MKDFNPAKFFKEVKQEGQKIVWPTKKETLITTAMVFVMVLIFSLFFLLVDNIISWWKRKAGKRYDKLKKEGRFRTEVELWTEDQDIQIIR